ncbi:SSI family serine proteinase inhibitor [Streptomyces sp. NPDC007088]|uniref:SSI family serine proteinase inhibitor n=1 Tax=Streptomyces sp. NPDC007088 TaxID=3364773 RepID=UPI0036C48AB1
MTGLRLASLLAAATLLTAASGAAHATTVPAPPPDAGTARLLLTVEGSGSTWIRGLRLDCPPDTSPPSHHPYAREACAEVSAAEGDFDALAGAPRPCAFVYDPVTAKARGTYGGSEVAWTRTFPNSCALEAATGHVFRF